MRAQRYKKTIPEQKFLVPNGYVCPFVRDCVVAYRAFALFRICAKRLLVPCSNLIYGLSKWLFLV